MIVVSIRQEIKKKKIDNRVREKVTMNCPYHENANNNQ